MKREGLFINLSVILLCITAFFFTIIGNGYILLLISVIPVLPGVLNQLRFIDRNSRWWAIFLTISVFSMMISSDTFRSLQFVYFMAVCYAVKVFLSRQQGWQGCFYKVAYICSLVCVLVTILSSIIPTFVVSLASHLYTGEALALYLQLFGNNSFAGLAGQTGANAYYISIFLVLVASNLFDQKKKLVNYCLLGLGLVALLLTKKRSFLISHAIGIVVLFIFSTAGEKNKGKKIATFIIFLSIIALVLMYSPAVQGMLDKMTIYINQGDITNGRLDLWSDTLAYWIKSPIVGVGVNALESTYGISTHNVYLQLLAEMGVLGLFAFVAMVIGMFIHTVVGYGRLLKHQAVSARAKALCGASVYMQVVFIIDSFTENPLYSLSFVLPYALFVAVAESYQNNNAAETNNNPKSRLLEHA